MTSAEADVNEPPLPTAARDPLEAIADQAATDHVHAMLAGRTWRDRLPALLVFGLPFVMAAITEASLITTGAVIKRVGLPPGDYALVLALAVFVGNAAVVSGGAAYGTMIDPRTVTEKIPKAVGNAIAAPIVYAIFIAILGFLTACVV